MALIQKNLRLEKLRFGLVSRMDIAQIQSELAQDGLLIDVRTPEEYAEGHVKDALLIPHTQFSQLTFQLKKTPPFTSIVKWDLVLNLLQEY